MKNQSPIRPSDIAATASSGETTSVQSTSPAPAVKGGDPQLPHEHDESSHSQASAAPQQRDAGHRAYRNATDGTSDTDRGPVMDEVYNQQVAPHRGPETPRR